MSPREVDSLPHSYFMDQPRRLFRLSDRMGTKANDGGGYGLVPVMATLSSRGDVLVCATVLEREVDKRREMACSPPFPFAFACLE